MDILDWSIIAKISYWQKSTSIFSKINTGPVQPRTVRGWPPNRQNMPPAKACPRKDSRTPWRPSVISPRNPPNVMALVMVAR